MKRGSKNRIFIRLTAGIAAALSAFVLGIAVFGAYTNVNSVKRVVSTQGLSGTAFSSNYLNLAAKDALSYTLKTITLSESGETSTFEVNVCNYVHNNPSQVNEKTIAYTFTLTLYNLDGTRNTSDFTGLSVTYNGNTQYSFTDGECVIIGNSLAGGTKSVDSFRITVPRSFMDTVHIQAVAEPNDASYLYTDNYKLGRMFAFSSGGETETNWTGSFTETTAQGYDGFNYGVKGQGKGTVTLAWDSTQLEINKVFLDKYGLAEASSGNMKSVSFSVDSDLQSRYDIQFYKTETGVYTDIATLSGYVNFTFAGA
ncbi:MAG: hypothetical protein ACI4J1_09055 [Ruminiclostridium sp.]